MEAIKQIVRTPKNHKIQMNIPQSVPENTLIEVILLVSTPQHDVDLNSLLQPSEAVDEKTRAFLAFSGTWEDDRPVEEIIRDIYESRTLGREDIPL